MRRHLCVVCFSIILQYISCTKNQSEILLEKLKDDSDIQNTSQKYFISDLNKAINYTSLDLNLGKRNNSKYSQWSKWSDCHENLCVRIRKRTCILKHKCGSTVQTEERRCKFLKRKGRRRVKCGRNRWKERNPNKSFDIENPRRKYRFNIIRPQKETLEKKILPSKASKWYSKWSRWSSCNRQCITKRKRWCRKPKFCAQDVITETAYCYVEGTYCQRWISKKIYHSKNNSKELYVDTVIEEFGKDRNEVEHSNSVHQYSAQSQCGIQNSKTSGYKKSAWSLTRIIGGRQSPKGKWPWQVAILNKYKEAFCGGTLVAPRWVLTAAHCIRRRLFVRLGEHSLSNQDGTETEVRVIQTIVHPGYDSDTVDNDVALLRLPPLPKYFLQLNVACLPKTRQNLPTNKLCTIIGWGKRKSTDLFGADILHEAQVPIVSTDSCKNTYIDYYITTNMFCAGYKKGRMDTCAGDSGGPLLCKDPSQSHQPWTLFGITSFGDGCGKKGKYGIYTRVPNYVRWINKVLRMSEYHNR